MAVARLTVTQPGPSHAAPSNLSDEVELYQRTYTTLLRSSGETRLRVLESMHMAMGSSLHPLADSDELDLGAFIYAIRRLPDSIVRTTVVVMGQDAAAFTRAGVGPLEEWESVEAPARRRRWYDGGDEVLAVLLASESDVDDLIPTLVAFQIEWNKIRRRMRAAGWPPAEGVTPEACAAALGGSPDDWARLAQAWGDAFEDRLAVMAEHGKSLRVRMLGGTQVGYQRMTRRWWSPVREALNERRVGDAPLYFVSSNTHALSNLVTGLAREREDELVDFVERGDDEDLKEELARFRDGRTEGSWENFMYFVARDFFDAGGPELRRKRHEAEVAAGVEHLRSKTAMRVAAQVIPLARLDPKRLDPRLGPVDADRLLRSEAAIVNVDYPLGLAAYNLLREVAIDSADLRGVYVLGKAATLNADVGDVMISSVIHDEHSGTTYWLDNAFTVNDIAPDLMFGTGLDNQRAVTVKSTFLQNRAYLDFYYREAFTVVEMEAGPYCNAVYEIADAERYPVGEAVNFSKLPIDFGIIHYASDTPYTQARTLGARGLSYYGMDSTYASSLAILRRVLRLEGALGEEEGQPGPGNPAR
ncbi:MAG: hypothetical protein QOJ82_383 [Solirubrobacteraceae bacterium]|nr:hypothetical protein [Solirubrobacteraceae bacterium]MEA2392492.1 hypothetical protein [Solirubrobacteraceae bacterium]